MLFQRGDMMKSGQAAMEFLMTYGWALLAVLVAIAVLAAMGVFQSKVGYDACVAGTGLSCKDFKVQQITGPGIPDDGRIEIQFLNGFGKDIADFFVTIDPASRYCPGITGVVASKILRDRSFSAVQESLRADQTLPVIGAIAGSQGMDCNDNLANCCLGYNAALGPVPPPPNPPVFPDSGVRVPCGTLTACAGPTGSPNRLPSHGSRVNLNFFMTYRFGDSSSLLHSRKGYIATTVQAPP